MSTSPDKNTRPKKKLLIQSARHLIAHKTTTTAIYLYAIHFLNYLVPAATVAVLTRRFSPSTYGCLIIAQSLGFSVGAFTEYGFRWTGARAVAESVSSASTLGRLVSSIITAKLLIAAACSVLIPLYILCIRSLSGHALLVAEGYFWGVILGSDLQWYFLGRERLRGYLTVDALLRALGIVLIFALVRDDRDVSKVLLIQSMCMLTVLIWASRRVTAEVHLVFPTKRGTIGALRDGGTLFLQQLARYTTGGINVAVLGMVASPADVGFFGCADKLVRYLSELKVPITQIFYPKISRRIGETGDQGAKPLARLAGTISLIIAGIATTALLAMPKTIILVLYGRKMLPALPALRVLASFPVLNSLTSSLVYYWLLPRKKESTSLYVLILAGAFNVIGVATLGRAWKQTGAATAVLLTETITIVGYVLAMRLSTPRKDIDKTVDLPALVEEAS